MVGPNKDSQGGIATVIRNMISYNKKNEIILLNNWEEKKRKILFVKNFFRIKRKINRENIDIVHFHVAQKGSFYRKSLLLLRIPKKTKTVFHMHASQFDQFYDQSNFFMKKYIRYILNKADIVVAVSKRWKDYYSELTKINIEFINNAVLIPDQISCDLNAKNIITLGRIGQRKGSYDILKVAEIVQMKDPDIQFYLYGDGEGEALKQKALKMKLANLHVKSWINEQEKIDLFKHSALHLLPSYHEGLPMAILESMSYGIPNVTTDIGGISTVVTDSVNGFLTAPGETEKMAIIILNYVHLNHEKKGTVIHNACETIRADFSLDNYNKQWIELYNKLFENVL